MGEVNVKEGSERAAAQTLEEEEAGGLEGPVGDEGEIELLWPWLGACRCNCRAFASDFSCVRTKYAKFCSISVSVLQDDVVVHTYSYEDLSILCVHDLWLADADCI